ncbi:MAG: CAP domain-containing protein [Chloroflexi bacterium]|nr:CAP domain-containing protein [Chloroflexota bacterium]
MITSNKFLRLPPISTDRAHYKPRAQRPLHFAYLLLSALFVIAMGALIFATEASRAPALTQIGVGWYFNDGNAGTAFQPTGNDSPIIAASISDTIGFERQLLALINRARAERGLLLLRSNETLTLAARVHAREMARTRKFDVTNEQDQTPRERAQAVGFSNPAVQVELISAGAQKPELVLNAFLNDPNAAQNIFQADVNEIGIGYASARGDPTAHYWTIDFARRSAISFTAVVNGGAESTTDRNVTLNIGGKGWARQMQISNAPDFKNAQWENFTENKKWTLTDNSGPKKVYVKLRGDGSQETLVIAEIALVPLFKGQATGAHVEVSALRAPRPPRLSAPNLPGGPVGAPIADALKPSFYQTSEFMLGKVAVGIIFPQCKGMIDRCTETWNDDAMNQVVQQIQTAMNWWNARTNGRVTFEYDQRRQIATSYEPINRPQSDEGLWIADTLTTMGFGGANYFEQVYAYNNWLRQHQNADWAFTIFVANSLASTTGTFSNGYFAYAYVPGPFLVVTYDNDGYGISKMAAVVAHETGHIFGALDQYTGASVPCTQTSGYLAAQNQNSDLAGCASNVTSIMRGGSAPYINNAIDSYALAQIGARVSLANGIPDPINTTVKVTLNAPQGDGTATISINGLAQDFPFPLSNPDTIDINYIALVQYRVDGGAWQLAQPLQSAAFNQIEQGFSFSVSVNGGTHTIDVMATNRVGNIGTASINVTGAGAAVTATIIPPTATSTRVPSTNTPVLPSATIFVPPTATRVPLTNTPIVPTATFFPTSTPLTPTSTNVAPTFSPTRESATATPTRVTPTATLIAPTIVPTPQPVADRNTIVIAINAGNTALALPSSSYRASTLIAAINAQGGSAYEVNRWTGRTWEAYAPSGGASDYNIEPGSGYMIKARAASIFRVGIDPAQQFKQVQVRKGWDFIGAPLCANGTQSCYTALTLATTINAQGGGVAEIDRWENGGWKAYLIGYSQNDFPIIVGQGYYIRSTKTTNWKPD